MIITLKEIFLLSFVLSIRLFTAAAAHILLCKFPLLMRWRWLVHDCACVHVSVNPLQIIIINPLLMI